MTTDTELDRALDRWLAEGRTVVADRVIDAALLQVSTTRQRGANRLTRRYSTMTTIARGTERPWTRILIAAAVLVVALVGLRLVGALNVAAPTEDPILGSGARFTSERYAYSIRAPGRRARPRLRAGRVRMSTPARAGPQSELS